MHLAFAVEDQSRTGRSFESTAYFSGDTFEKKEFAMKNILVGVLLSSALLYAMKSSVAGADAMKDPGVTAACQSVWTACEGANVTDPANGKNGYLPGEYKQGDGLWANCIGPLANGKGKGYPVPGLTNPAKPAGSKNLSNCAENLLRRYSNRPLS